MRIIIQKERIPPSTIDIVDKIRVTTLNDLSCTVIGVSFLILFNATIAKTNGAITKQHKKANATKRLLENG